MKVAENCKNKNTAARLIGSECLEFILKEYPKYLLDQGEQSTGVLLETLTATIKSVLQDQNPKIREIGKMIYVSFFEKYPEKANLILNSLQNPIKKQLEEIQKHKTLD